MSMARNGQPAREGFCDSSTPSDATRLSWSLSRECMDQMVPNQLPISKKKLLEKIQLKPSGPHQNTCSKKHGLLCTTPQCSGYVWQCSLLDKIPPDFVPGLRLRCCASSGVSLAVSLVSGSAAPNGRILSTEYPHQIQEKTSFDWGTGFFQTLRLM